MMTFREILFRGKRVDNCDWVYGDLHAVYFKNHDVIMISPSEDEVYKVIPETVGQYTGLTDKNGKKIFEGDILLNTYSEYLKAITEVVWYDGGWAIKEGNFEPDAFHIDTARVSKVVGNIHDNPEQLEVE